MAYFRDGKAAWNPYSFGDIAVFEDGTLGPWMKVYDPAGQMACGNPPWKPIDVLTIPLESQISIEPEDEFEPYIPPAYLNRFPGCPQIPAIHPLPQSVRTPRVE